MDNEKDQDQTTGEAESYDAFPSSAEEEEQDEGYDSLPCPDEAPGTGNQVSTAPASTIVHASVSFSLHNLVQALSELSWGVSYTRERACDVLHCRNKIDHEEDKGLRNTQNRSTQSPFSPLDASPQISETNPLVCSILYDVQSKPLTQLPQLELTDADFALTEEHINELMSSAVDNADALAALVLRQDEAVSPSRRRYASVYRDHPYSCVSRGRAD